MAHTSPVSDLAIVNAMTCMLKLVPSVPAMYIHVVVGSAAFLYYAHVGKRAGYKDF